MTIWCTLEEAVTTVQSGDRIFVQGACSTPTPLLEALVARGETLHDVEITHLHTYGPTPYTDARWEGHFRLRALFVSANTRAAVNSGRASYAPIFLSDIPALFACENGLPLDVAFLQVSPPDAHGYCSLGPSVDVTRAAVDHARHVIALVNPHVPRVHGEGFLSLDRITRAVRWDEPLYTVERAQPDETQTRIGEQVATLIEDGATLQLGIGAIPDATLRALADRRDLGVHSEMFSDGVLDLVERGVITGARKAIDRGKIVASFVIGSRHLLDFIDDNPIVELRSADYTNNTHLIRQFEHMVAVNSAIQVDLTGQVCAESLGVAHLQRRRRPDGLHAWRRARRQGASDHRITGHGPSPRHPNADEHAGRDGCASGWTESRASCRSSRQARVSPPRARMFTTSSPSMASPRCMDAT